jgi:hypothetical protein
MYASGFVPETPAIKRLHLYALNCTATGMGLISVKVNEFKGA